MTARLSIIILSYNTAELVIQCLSSLSALFKEQLATGEFEIIVVDNNSLDNTVEKLKQKKFPFKTFTVIVNKENLGFAKGNNKGVKKAQAPYILFLNSDTKMLTDGLEAALDFLKKEKTVAVVLGKLVDVQGNVSEGSVGRFYSPISVFFSLFLGVLDTHYTPSTARLVDWGPGAAMLVKKDIFENIGGFDEHFFMYIEDMDLCLRMKKNGYSAYFFPDLLVQHQKQGSSNRSYAIMMIFKNLLYYFRKHYIYPVYLMVKSILVFRCVAAIFTGFLLHNEYLRKTYTKTLKVII